MPTKPTPPINLASAADMALTQMEQADKMFRDDPEWQAALNALRKALKAKPKPTKLHVLLIESDNTGPMLSVHRTKQGAEASLSAWIAENWEAQWGEMPTDHDELTEAYSEWDEDFSGAIEECEVES